MSAHKQRCVRGTIAFDFRKRALPYALHHCRVCKTFELFRRCSRHSACRCCNRRRSRRRHGHGSAHRSRYSSRYGALNSGFTFFRLRLNRSGSVIFDRFHLRDRRRARFGRRRRLGRSHESCPLRDRCNHRRHRRNRSSLVRSCRHRRARYRCSPRPASSDSRYRTLLQRFHALRQ